MTQETLETTDETLSEESEESLQQETPVEPELDKTEVWQKLTQPQVEEQTSEPELEAVEETPAEEPKKIEKPQPKDELLNDPKLVKRFKDSQDFIQKLKSENRQLSEQFQELQKQVNELQAKKEVKTEEAPTTVAEVQGEVKRLIANLPEKVREEVEAFPELFAGVNALMDSKLGEMRKLVEPDLEQVRKERHQKQVQQALTDRHRLANDKLGITNAKELDFDNPTFAQWVLSSDWRKKVVTTFDQPEPFVDLLRGFLFEYPEEAKSSVVQEVVPETVAKPVKEKAHRKTASAVVSRKNLPEKPKLKIMNPQDKTQYWEKLVRGTG